MYYGARRFLCYSVHASEIVPLVLKELEMRTAVQVLREMSLIKSNTKGDPVLQKVLLAPLQEELQAIAKSAESQMKFELEAKKK